MSPIHLLIPALFFIALGLLRLVARRSTKAPSSDPAFSHLDFAPTGFTPDWAALFQDSLPSPVRRKSKSPVPVQATAESAAPSEPIQSPEMHSESPVSSEPPRKPRPKKPIPQTLEEYEATRKPLPSFPLYQPNLELLQLVDAYLDAAESRTPSPSPGNHPPEPKAPGLQPNSLVEPPPPISDLSISDSSIFEPNNSAPNTASPPLARRKWLTLFLAPAKIAVRGLYSLFRPLQRFCNRLFAR